MEREKSGYGFWFVEDYAWTQGEVCPALVIDGVGELGEERLLYWGEDEVRKIRQLEQGTMNDKVDVLTKVYGGIKEGRLVILGNEAKKYGERGFIERFGEGAGEIVVGSGGRVSRWLRLS